MKRSRLERRRYKEQQERRREVEDYLQWEALLWKVFDKYRHEHGTGRTFTSNAKWAYEEVLRSLDAAEGSLTEKDFYGDENRKRTWRRYAAVWEAIGLTERNGEGRDFIDPTMEFLKGLIE